MKNYNRYQVYPTVNLKDRTWPKKKITKLDVVILGADIALNKI